MRKVDLSMILPDMRLGKSIYHYNQLLLTAGINNISRFSDSLLKLGITSIYVEDEISTDIEITDAISDVTRLKCKDALQNAINRFRVQGSFDMCSISEATSSLIDEILLRPDVLICLNDIATTDDSTLVHSINTTVFSLLIGQQLKLSPIELKALAEGTILHDIGKTLVDPKILYKNGILNTDEFEIVKQHTIAGYELLKTNPLLTELSRIISLQHHERLDGSGYPYGLTANEIHPFAKIVAIADMFDALTAERCYRKSLTNYQAYQILAHESTIKLDAPLLGQFLKNIAIYPNGTLVNLSDGSRGIIKIQNPGLPFNPIVMVLNTIDDKDVRLYDLDLSSTFNITIQDSNT
ncbi:HD-GYP domain-containing protein [[Clostridium] fimetarium]|uniref:HD domain-containing protein n=1 Tax=[Clostridium] fimetarium TaxID=99656 RepID=A0A1I0R193_9FIRM|nr:HD-GYP domain-containing protein [[Clostridium] fimetarium]SEW34238.1 HD domain-containing protein [[Clostridium] fimetarium]